MQATANDPNLTNHGTISGGKQFSGNWVGMYGSSNNSINYNFTNFGTITINKSGTSTVYGMYADVGIEYKKDNFSVSLNYEGGFGAHQTSHGGNIMLKLEF